MSMRHAVARTALRPHFLSARTTTASQSLTPIFTQARHLTNASGARRIPKPVPFVPDVQTFLSLIGRELKQHSEKISSWDDLFSITSQQLRDLGIEPARSRKYLLRWIDKYRHGEFGLGGDAKFVGPDGSVELRLVEVQLNPEEAAKRELSIAKASLTTTPNTIRRVLNVPSTTPPAAAEGAEEPSEPAAETDADPQEPSTAVPVPITVSRLPELSKDVLEQARPVLGISHQPGRGIRGPHVQTVKGTKGLVAVLFPQEGLWEHKRGHKVDGGERRKAEVRSKRRSAERRAGRA